MRTAQAFEHCSTELLSLYIYICNPALDSHYRTPSSLLPSLSSSLSFLVSLLLAFSSIEQDALNMAPPKKRVTFSAYLILWLSVFNFNGVCAITLKPLDQPITAISSGEFGLPAGLSVQLHSYVEAIGDDAETIVRRAYTEEDTQPREETVSRRAPRRGLGSIVSGLWDLTWNVTKVFINPMSWTSGLQLASFACTMLGWWSSAPSWVTYTCNSVGLLSTFFSVWQGRKDLATAWSDYRNSGTYKGNQESLALLPFYDYYADESNSGRRSVNNGTVQRGKEAGYYDWSVLHPYLANRTVSNAKHGNASLLHDVGRNYSIITMAHIINSSDANPVLVQRSLNGTLMGTPVSMFFVNGTGSSAGFGAHHAFGVAPTANSTSKRNCDGADDETGPIYADNQELCAGEGTETPDGITGVYFGMDMYGTETQWEDFDEDMGGQDPDSNGAWELANNLSDSIYEGQWWRACMCDQENGDYAWTGALQYTWSGGYNGYSDCYSGTCGGATA